MRGAFGRRGVRADAAGQLSFDRVDAVVGSPATAIQARDLNGDGRLDLVVSGGQRVFVLTGQGDGRFDVTWSGAAGENPMDLAIADLDEDGLADLAVANHETDYVTLLFGIAGRGLRTPGPLEIPRRRLATSARRSPAGHRLRWPRGPPGRRPVARVHPAVPGSRRWHILGGNIDRRRRRPVPGQ